MKYNETSTITVSQDTLTNPLSIRFQETLTDVDITSLTQIEEKTMAFPNNSTTVVNMGLITTAKFLWIKAEKDIQLLINGSVTPLPIVGGKSTKLWTAITSLSIVVPLQTPANPVIVSLVLAG